MNNTTTSRYLTTIVVIFMAATLVVGIGTLATTTTTNAFAYMKKDNGKGNDNGNTVNIQKCRQDGTQSGFDNSFEQDCQNLICTHPGENAACSTPAIQVSGQAEGENFCPGPYESAPASITFSAQQSGSAAVQGQFEISVLAGFLIKTGTLDSVQITGNSFTITGTELSQDGRGTHCINSQLPSTATITGQCGTGVTMQFRTADGEHATFTGNVACTTT